MERRPLRHQSFAMLWKILFLVVMELGIRNDLVDPDTGTPHEENEAAQLCGSVLKGDINIPKDMITRLSLLSFSDCHDDSAGV